MNRFQEEGIIVGPSGGIDSSLVAVLAARIFFQEKVWNLILPERDNRSRAADHSSKGLTHSISCHHLTPHLSGHGSRAASIEFNLSLLRN